MQTASTPIETATQALLAPAEFATGDLERLLGRTMTSGIEFAEVYFQSVASESWSLEDGIVKDAGFHVERGLGVRAIAGEKTGFAYADDIRLPALEQAAGAARSIVRHGGEGRVATLQGGTSVARYGAADPRASLDNETKVARLQALDALARSSDPRVVEVAVSLVSTYEHVLVAATDGTLAADVRPLVRLNVSVIVEKDGRRERGYTGCGGRHDYALLFADGRAEALVHEAVRLAGVNLEAVDAPAGRMPVVLGPGWPGVLLHEAVGHGLEADFNRKGTSVYAGRVGERVASSLCTIVDDGTLMDRRGSLTIDDEGAPTACNLLIENGILVGYMQDRLNAKLMGLARTGNGRRQSYAHLPMPRMTNTYMLAGTDDPEEIVRSVRRGIYAANLGGGQVDLTSGNFVFSTSEAYLIEDGRITAPVKGATLIGNGPQAMERVSMVGADMALDEGVGICGKDGQSVPVGVGQPTLKLDELTVGGTGA